MPVYEFIFNIDFGSLIAFGNPRKISLEIICTYRTYLNIPILYFGVLKEH